MRQSRRDQPRLHPGPEEFLAKLPMVFEAHLQAACCDLVLDAVRISGKVKLKVAGASMVPALWPGDLVSVRHCAPSELGPGSVIVFRQNQRLIIHRLIHRTGDSIVTRGDARPRFDENVRAGDVLGFVETVVRNGRSVKLHFSPWQKAVAFTLRHSEWCTWFFLRVSSRLRRMGVAGPA